MDREFFWTAKSLPITTITKKIEPIQPLMLAQMSIAMDAEYFLDIGANVGFYSIYLSNKLKWKKIYAFEPAPITYHELKANILMNGLNGLIIPQNVAISNNDGREKFIVFGEVSGINSLASSTVHGDKTYSNFISVTTQTLDSWLSKSCKLENYSRLVLKIDTEGNEISILEGSENLLNNNICLLQIESFEDNCDILHDFLIQRNYNHIFDIGKDKYYSNYIDGFNLPELISTVYGHYIRLSCRPLTPKSNPISYTVNTAPDNIHIYVNVDAEIFSIPEFLIYIVNDGKADRIMGWQQDNMFVVPKQLFNHGATHGINIFVRDTNNPSIKMNNFISLHDSQILITNGDS